MCALESLIATQTRQDWKAAAAKLCRKKEENLEKNKEKNREREIENECERETHRERENRHKDEEERHFEVCRTFFENRGSCSLIKRMSTKGQTVRKREKGGRVSLSKP
jgi:hypothetical protein